MARVVRKYVNSWLALCITLALILIPAAFFILFPDISIPSLDGWWPKYKILSEYCVSKSCIMHPKTVQYIYEVNCITPVILLLFHIAFNIVRVDAIMLFRRSIGILLLTAYAYHEAMGTFQFETERWSPYESNVYSSYTGLLRTILPCFTAALIVITYFQIDQKERSEERRVIG